MARAVRVRKWAAWWLTAFVLWLLLISQISVFEVVLGIAAATIAATGTFMVTSRDNVSFEFALSDVLLLVRRLPPSVARDSLRVFLVVVRRILGQRVRGRMVTLPFQYGLENDPHEAGRRALVVAGVSLAPNTILVRMANDHIDVHRLLPQPTTQVDPRWPL